MNNIEESISELAKMKDPAGFAYNQLQMMARGNKDIAEALKSPEEYIRKTCAARGIDADELLKMVQKSIKM